MSIEASSGCDITITVSIFRFFVYSHIAIKWENGDSELNQGKKRDVREREENK